MTNDEIETTGAMSVSPPTNDRRRRLVASLGVVGLLAVVVLIVATRGGGAEENHRISGSFVLVDEDIFPGFLGGKGCEGRGGYDDVTEGLQVLVKDGQGEAVATSRLGEGIANTSKTVCSFPFSIEVPDAKFYEISVGRRGSLSYSKGDLEARDWRVEFSLGT